MEARIAFPEYLVSDAPVTEDINYSETLTQEEKEYSESDKSDLLRARENAAKEVGRLAWNEKMRKRMTVFFAVISLFASYLGMLTILRTGRELKAGNEKTAFELQDIAQISPPEAGFLLKGRAEHGRSFQDCSIRYIKEDLKWRSTSMREGSPEFQNTRECRNRRC